MLSIYSHTVCTFIIMCRFLYKSMDIQMQIHALCMHALLYNILHVNALIGFLQEVLKKICSWQFINCVDLWVMFISVNIRDYDLHSLLYMIVQVINGMTHLFPGPRYFPLKVKCIQLLNHLSSSSGIFIPVSSLVLDALEYKVDKEYAKSGMALNFLSALKVRNVDEIDLPEVINQYLPALSYSFLVWNLLFLPICPPFSSRTFNRLEKFLII